MVHRVLWKPKHMKNTKDVFAFVFYLLFFGGVFFLVCLIRQNTVQGLEPSCTCARAEPDVCGLTVCGADRVVWLFCM